MEIKSKLSFLVSGYMRLVSNSFNENMVSDLIEQSRNGRRSNCFYNFKSY